MNTLTEIKRPSTRDLYARAHASVYAALPAWKRKLLDEDLENKNLSSRVMVEFAEAVEARVDEMDQ